MKIKKYDSYRNNLIFEGFRDLFNFGKKDKKSKTEKEVSFALNHDEPELPKPKKNAKESDQDMIDLISDIKNNFNIKMMKPGHSDSELVDYQNSKRSVSLTYDYRVNDIPIRLTYRFGGWNLSINDQYVSMILISPYLLEDLLDFFILNEIQEKINNNNKIFNKAIASRREAEKYNL